MKSALQFHSNRFRLIEDDDYATSDDFQRLFAREMTDFFRLSLQLTADGDNAESCLSFAMKDCFANNSVAKRWAPIWARRMVICNAISLVFGTENAIPDNSSSETSSEIHLFPSVYRFEPLRESLAILELPDLERLVFVICILERYSIQDCALLLRRSPKDVNEARARAIIQIASVEKWNLDESSATFPTCQRSFRGNEERRLDESCGSLLD
jgi:hypothetical protein